MEEQSALTKPNPAGTRSPTVRLANLLAIAVVVLAAFVAWQWYDAGLHTAALREEVARRLRDSDNDSRDARNIARQAQEAVRDAQAKLAQLETKLVESQNQQVALEALYEELSRSRDEWVLAEVEQILAIAVQQLQLVGSVQAALAALQTADSRLARSNRPQFLPLRKVLARDIERLKGTPGVDIAGLALRLDQVIARIDTLPLGTIEAVKAEPTQSEARSEGGFWKRLGLDLWGELKQLVRVSKLDAPEPPLLSPSQAFFVRENLKLRLLNARLALLSRDQNVFRADLNQAETWIRRYFNVRARPAVAALANLKQLAASGINIDLPNIRDSLEAVRNYKLSREKVAR